MVVEKPKLDEGRLREALRKVAGINLPPKGEPLEGQTLPEPVVGQIMEGMGRYLAKLHSVKLAGFGYLDEGRLNSDGTLVGKYRSWYEFWLNFFDTQVTKLDEVLDEEKRTGVVGTPLDQKTRDTFEHLLTKRGAVRELIVANQALLELPGPRLLNGNIHLGSVFVKDGRFTGLEDFRQTLAGDPVDDLAYFSVMPTGDENIQLVR